MLKLRRIAAYLLVLGLAVAGPGCPRNNNIDKEGDAKVTILFHSSMNSLASALMKAVNPKAVVAASEIYSLTVTVTQISLDQSGDDEDGEEEGEGEDDKGDDNGNSLVIFDGSQDVDLLALEGLSQVFSTSDIPAGTYHKIRLAIENPRLRLVDEPETEITNIKTTANGHLFVSETIEIPDGENTLIELSFADLHLVRNGNGRYVLTPQLSVDIATSSADVVASGTIASVDVDNDEMDVTLAEGDSLVLYAGAAIFLPADTDTPTGIEADLVVGTSVEITGTIDLDGVITASEIRVL